MTNNPTIDGVSRERIAFIRSQVDFGALIDPKAARDLLKVIDHQNEMALKIAPAVEQQEPIGELEIYGYQCRQSEQEKFFLCGYPQFWQHIALVRKDDAEAQTSTLQSTIAQLKARIAELESGRGERVAYVLTRDGEVCYEADDGIVISNTPGDENNLYKWKPVYFTTPPALVAVELLRKARGSVSYLSLRGDDIGDENHALLQHIEACLDATAALNGPDK